MSYYLALSWIRAALGQMFTRASQPNRNPFHFASQYRKMLYVLQLVGRLNLNNVFGALSNGMSDLVLVAGRSASRSDMTWLCRWRGSCDICSGMGHRLRCRSIGWPWQLDNGLRKDCRVWRRSVGDGFAGSGRSAMGCNGNIGLAGCVGDCDPQLTLWIIGVATLRGLTANEYGWDTMA